MTNENVTCTSEGFCALGRGLPCPKTQNLLQVQDTFPIDPRMMEPVSPMTKGEIYAFCHGISKLDLVSKRPPLH